MTHSQSGNARGPRWLEELAVPDDLDRTSELISQAQRGDEWAQDRLFKRVQPMLERIIRRKLGADPRALAETQDCLNEGLLDLCRQLPRLESPSTADFMRVAVKVVSNKVRDLAKAARRDKRDVRREQAIESGPETGGGMQVAARDPSPTSLVRANELEERIDGLLRTFDPQDRDLILLRKEHGFTNEELAELLGLSKDAARMRLTRAIKRLADLLGEDAS